jgi:hypothetical protein
MLLEIISRSDLLATIHEEIALFSKILPDDELRIDAGGLVKSCPVFKATFFETMWLYTAGMSYKKALQDGTFTESAEDAAIFGKPKPQTYHIAAGNYLVIPHETMQTDPWLWQNLTAFDARRFLVADEKDQRLRVETRHLNAFGGGHTICRGRYFAEREVLIFLAGYLTA